MSEKTGDILERRRLKEITKELVEMRKIDQEMRLASQAGKREFDPKVDKDNCLKLKSIIEEIKWPTISKVGKEASQLAWLITQHADLDVNFQEHCLKLMEDTEKDEVDPMNIAYLIDRIAVNRGKEQIYGTQFHIDKNGKLVPRPIENVSKLDDLRDTMGLEPFERNWLAMKNTYKRK